MLELAAAGAIFHRLGNRPATAAIPAERNGRKTHRCAIHTENISVVQFDDVALFLHGAEGGISDAFFAVGQHFPVDFLRVRFGEDIVGAEGPALAFVLHAATDLREGQQYVLTAGRDDGLIDAPEHLHLAAPIVSLFQSTSVTRNGRR